MSGLSQIAELLGPRIAPHLNELKGVVDIRDWSGLDLTGANDNASIVQAWQDQARTARMLAVAPPGRIRVGSKVTVKGPIAGSGGWSGDFSNGSALATIRGPKTTFVSGINDGGVLFELDASTSAQDDWANGFWMRDVMFDGDLQDVQLFVVVESGVDTGRKIRRFVLERVVWRRATVGADLEGFVGTIYSCSAYANAGVGLHLKGSNGVQLIGGEYVAGVNGWAVRLSPATLGSGGQAGVTLNGVVIESGLTGANGLDIEEKMFNVVLNNTYFEAHPGYHLRVGANGTGAEADAARNITIIGGYVTASGTVGECLFDNVNGLDFVGRFYHTGRVRFTNKAINISGAPVPRHTSPNIEYAPSSGNGLVSGGNIIGRKAQNYFPNPNFRGGLRGVHGAIFSSGLGLLSYGEDTTYTRDGVSSLRITHAAGAAEGASLTIYPLGQEELLSNAEGKRVRMSCWVYIPDNGSYGTGTIYPAVQVGYVNSSGSLQTTQYAMNLTSLAPGNWHFYTCSRLVTDVHPSDPRFQVRFLPVQGSANARSVDHSIYVSDVYFGVDMGSSNDLVAGDWVTAPASGLMMGGKVEMRMTSARAAAIIADARLSFATGDIIWYTDAAAGSAPGIYCTTGGAGGTAVFKAMASLAA